MLTMEIVLPSSNFTTNAIYLYIFICLSKWYRASSILQNNTKLYSPYYILQDSDMHCWNSNPGEEQYLILKFGRTVRMMELKLQFQAGFSSELLRVRLRNTNNSTSWHNCLVLENDNDNDNDDEEEEVVEPEDTFGIQNFPLLGHEGTELWIEFKNLRDFYGRVIIYRLQVWGLEVES
jgi:hypothetical protein